jgi:hypothetical protein
VTAIVGRIPVRVEAFVSSWLIKICFFAVIWYNFKLIYLFQLASHVNNIVCFVKRHKLKLFSFLSSCWWYEFKTIQPLHSLCFQSSISGAESDGALPGTTRTCLSVWTCLSCNLLTL